MADEEVITVAYDGECLLCSRGIRFLAEQDRHKRLRFVPLQTPLGRAMEAKAGTGSLSSVLMEKGGKVYSRSDGLLVAGRALGGIWALLAKVFGILPRSLRDKLYDWIAANRYRWFGKKDACSLPSGAVRERLLDGERV
jgi:predicted DCC family thiol-disulfide oxidoreductase YuxK